VGEAGYEHARKSSRIDQVDRPYGSLTASRATSASRAYEHVRIARSWSALKQPDHPTGELHRGL
jgi:hypothetical protein